MHCPCLQCQRKRSQELFHARRPADYKILVFVSEDEAIRLWTFEEDSRVTQQMGFKDRTVLLMTLLSKVGIAEEGKGFAQDG